MPGTGKKFDVSLVTPDGAGYEGEVEMIVVPGQIGEIGVLARHAPLIATLMDEVERTRGAESLSGRGRRGRRGSGARDAPPP